MGNFRYNFGKGIWLVMPVTSTSAHTLLVANAKVMRPQLRQSIEKTIKIQKYLKDKIQKHTKQNITKKRRELYRVRYLTKHIIQFYDVHKSLHRYLGVFC